MTRQRLDAAPGSTSTLRTANQHRVLDVLRGLGVVDPAVAGEDVDALPAEYTQAELARTTGLAPATVSNILRDLSSAGLVAIAPGSGRRGSSVRLAETAGVVAGVDFGHSHVAVAVGDLAGRLLHEERRPLHSGLDHRAALDCAHEMLLGMLPGGPTLRTVGLGLPAPVTADVVQSSAILPSWVGVNARTAAEQVFGATALVENDANLGALAEHRRGVGRGHRSSVFVKISSGVGAGV
ncbi:ROK family protein, partial [Nocardioides kribbensis]